MSNMPELNRIDINCVVKRDPEHRTTTTDKDVTTLNVFIPNGKSGTYMNVVFWEDLARRVNNNYKKGDLLFISGRIQSRSYEDRQGNKKTVVEIVGSEVHDHTHVERKVNAVREKLDRIEKKEDSEEIPF